MRLRFLNNLCICLLLTVCTSSCGLLLKRRTFAGSGIQNNASGLPLIIYQPSSTVSKKMAIMLSGDGGWLGFNDTLAVAFAKKGYHVIGFNSRTYFWHRKTPEETAKVFSDLITKYGAEWNIKRIVLSGYSFGADVVPFIYNRLPGELKSKISKLQLLSPFLSTDFKVRLSDLIMTGNDNRTYKVKDEVQRITIPIFCFYGASENPKPLADLSMKNFFIRTVPGDHHYLNSYRQIVHTMRNK